MDLGLALAAGNAYFEQGKRNEQYEYDKARRDADRSTLQDQTNANRSGYQLKSKQNTAELGLVDSRTDVARDELALKGGQVKGDLGRLPIDQQRQDLNAQAERDKALINTAIGQVDVANIPRAVMLQQQAGILKEAEASAAIIAGLSKYVVTANDPAGAAKYLNDLSAVAPEGRKLTSQVHSVGTVPSNPSDPNSPKVWVAVDANNQPVKRQDGTIWQLPAHLLTGPVKYEKLDAGETMVKTDGLGNVSPVYTAPESEKSKLAKKGPLERDVNYLMSGHGMTEAQALNHLSSAKKKSRDQFVLDSMKGIIDMGKRPSPEDEKYYGELYDRVNASGPGLNNTGQKGAAAAAVNPKIYSLTGVKPPVK